jgi:hypothetical protein
VIGNGEDIKIGEYVGKDNAGDKDEVEDREVEVCAIVVRGANGDLLSNGDVPLQPACRALSSSSSISISVMSKADLDID